MPDSKTQDVDGWSNPSVLLEKLIIKSSRVLNYFFSSAIILSQKPYQICLVLKQSDCKSHHFIIHVLDHHSLVRTHFPWRHQKVYHFLCSQIQFLKLHHVLIILVNSHDASGMKMTTYRMHSNNFFSNHQIGLSSFLHYIKITCLGNDLVWALISASLSC